MINNKESNYECCFCGEGIESTNIDPCAMNIMINIDKNKDKRYDQDFYCHIDCFKNRIVPIVSLYIAHLGYDEEEN